MYDDTYIWSEIVVALIVHLTRYSMSLCISETLQAIHSEDRDHSFTKPHTVYPQTFNLIKRCLGSMMWNLQLGDSSVTCVTFSQLFSSLKLCR